MPLGIAHEASINIRRVPMFPHQRCDFVHLVQIVFKCARVLGREGIPIVEERNVAIGEPADVVLVGKPPGVVHKCELIVHRVESKPPDDVPRPSADLRNFVHVPRRDQEVAIVIELDRVAVHVIDQGIRQCDVGGCEVRDGKVVPASPLEYHVLGRVEFLDDEAGDQCIGVTARDDGAHIDRLSIVAHQKRVTVGKQLELVEVGGVAVAGGEAVHDGVAAVHGEELVGSPQEISE